MKIWKIALVLTVLVTASPVAGKTADRVEVLLKATMHRELVDGDLQAAIEQYKYIVARADENRAVAAKALLHMGQAYEKLGRSEASAAYQRVLRDYADQQETVVLARVRLVALREPTPRDVASRLVVRQIWDRQAGAVSPDGRIVIFSRQDSLRVRDLRTGREHGLPVTSGMIFSGSPVISRDGEMVTYVSSTGQETELRTARLDGSNPRVLVRSDELPWLKPFDWLPDGKHILAVASRQDRTNQIVLISVADGSLQIIKSLEQRYPYKMSVSPDGRYIAYDVADKPRSPRDIFALATDGSRETLLVEHPARDRSAIWTPDGKSIVFVSDRTGTSELWVLPVHDGRPQGPPEVVRRNIGDIAPIGFTRSGAYYYTERDTFMQDVYIASLDAETMQVVGSPILVSERFRGANTLPDWSPDGRYLAYLSRLARPQTVDTVGSGIIVVRSLDTGEERDLFPQLNFLGDTRLRWAPDGRSLLISGEAVGGHDGHRRRGVYEIDAQTGAVTPIVVSTSNTQPAWRENRWHAEWSLDGTAIFYVRDNGQGCEIRFRDIKTGAEKVLYHPTSPTHLNNLALSPDGAWLAFGDGPGHYAADAVMVVPVTGGTPREVLRMEPDVVGRETYSFAWTQDGQHLVFSKRVSEPGRPSELWLVSLEGGEPQPVGLPMWGRGGVRVHPDGRRITFTNLTMPAATGLWVMENFLPGHEGT